MRGGRLGVGARSAALLRTAVVAMVLLMEPSPGITQEMTVVLSFNKELLYSLARDSGGERNEEFVDRLKGLSPAVKEVEIFRSGGTVTLAYTVIAAADITVDFNFILEKLALYRMAAAREDIDGMLAILEPARALEPLILDLSYRFNNHYSIIDIVLDLRPALKAREEAEMKKAAAAFVPPPPREPQEPPPPPEKKVEKKPPPREKAPAEVKKPAPAQKEPPYLSVVSLGKVSAPAIDGSAGDPSWGKAKPLTIQAGGDSGTMEINLAALRDQERIYFLVQWLDGKADREHRPWVWAESEYVVGKELEDALALQFSRQGRMGDCMLSGKGATADLWFWRAARTDPVSYAEDGTMTVSTERIPKANFYEARNKQAVWIKETRDRGTPPYGTQVVGTFEGERVQRYVPRTPAGSVADVQAKGEWSKGRWTVELSRSLRTDDENDVAFKAGQDQYFSLAVFDGRERGGHSTTKEHLLKIE